MRTLAAEDKSRIDTLVKECTKENAAQLEEASKRESKAMLAGLTQTVNNSVSAKLDAAVKREMKKLGSEVSKQACQSVEKHLVQENQIRAAKCDQSLREAVTKIAHSKPSIDQLGQGM